MSEGEACIAVLPSRADDTPVWLKVADGRISARSTGATLAWYDRDEDAPVTLLVLPPGASSLHRFSLPDLPHKQGSAVARRMAMEASIGGPTSVHAVALSGATPDGEHEIAVVSREDMAHFIAWGRQHGVDADIIVPAAALLPEPEKGFASATVGGQQVLRGEGLCLSADESFAAAVVGDAQVERTKPGAIDSAIVAALSDPSCNLRSGEFAKVESSALDPQQLVRIAVWIGFIALGALLVSLVMIAKLHWDSASLDARSVEIARSVLPAAYDSALVENELDARLAATGTGNGSFTGPLSALMQAMQPTPSVSLTLLERRSDGTLRANLASAKPEDINTVLLAIQTAGFVITATSSVDPTGRVIADITVAS
ncbi:type II secretion system protein GspL [Sphingobium subterraneum]|uniref:General secretion pathway protein L n=1 Tax=Sphingobium subterraneum TaxID=627688 RepID=A0A841J2D7_9SPHN|nr:type II secretion system protein GspL [Sphingobium subterraneum]MBB6122698.1 general secretion pathway protein L [Sphingobium subterraneum]